MVSSTPKRTPTSAKPTARRTAPAAPSKSVAGTVAEPAPAATAPDLPAVSDPVAVQADLKKKELVDLVVARSGIKKKDAKPVVEALLAVLGETLAENRELNLPPLGKLRINRTEDKPGYRVIICKLRQSNGARNQPGDPLAEDAG